MGRGQLGAEVRGQEELLKPQSGPRPHGQGERLGPACLEDTQPPGRVEPWQERPPGVLGPPPGPWHPPGPSPQAPSPEFTRNPALLQPHCGAGGRLRGSPSWPLLALHHVHTRLGHHQALFTRTFWKPPGQHRKPSPRHPRARPSAVGRGGQASESHTPGSGTVPISNPASLLSGPRKGRLSSEASASSPQHSQIAVLPGAAPRFFFSLLASVPLLQVLPLLPDGLF